MHDLDFLPPLLHRERIDNLGRRRYVVLAAIMAVVMGGWATVHAHTMRSLRRQAEQVRQEREQIRIHLSGAKTIAEDLAQVAAYQRLLQKLEDPASLAVLISEVTRLLPPAVAVTDFSLERPEAAPAPPVHKPLEPAAAKGQPVRTPAGPTRPELRIRGIAARSADVGAFAAAITGSPLFSDVISEVLGPAEHAGRRGVGFELRCSAMPQTGGPK